MSPDYVEMRLAYLGSEFEKDRNPMWAWEALHLWRTAFAEGLPPGTVIELPAWVVDYLAAAAANMFALIDLPKNQRMAVPIQNALMLNKHAGRGSLVEAWRQKRAFDAREARRTVAELEGDAAALDMNKARADSFRGMPTEKHRTRKYVEKLFTGRIVDAEALKPDNERDRKRRGRTSK